MKWSAVEMYPAKARDEVELDPEWLVGHTRPLDSLKAVAKSMQKVAALAKGKAGS